MPLRDRTKLPPGGFPYREPKINWSVPYALLEFNLIAKQIQQARLNNLHAGLDPDLFACKKALDDYTCARLHNDPAFCISPDSPLALAVEEKPRGCSSCGRRK